VADAVEPPVSDKLPEDRTERAIQNLAEAFCTLKRPNFQIYKVGIESVVRLALSEQLVRMQRDFEQASASLKD
jgi:hypothetical protein